MGAPYSYLRLHVPIELTQDVKDFYYTHFSEGEIDEDDENFENFERPLRLMISDYPKIKGFDLLVMSSYPYGRIREKYTDVLQKMVSRFPGVFGTYDEDAHRTRVVAVSDVKQVEKLGGLEKIWSDYHDVQFIKAYEHPYRTEEERADLDRKMGDLDDLIEHFGGPKKA